ncbi:MAG: hypothetical protein CM15mV10_2910 [uncultured marine virus]|nr:MAG: hypothetical protein CM15mV10_2910 [uncultured marine virus]
MNIPTYDFPHSPILIIGFFGILTALTVLLLLIDHTLIVHSMLIKNESNSNI